MKVKPGVAFPDFISSEKQKKRGDLYEKYLRTREFFIPLFLIIMVLGIVVKLFSLQVLKGSYYQDLSDTNRIKTITIYAPRGIILDSKGNPLTYNVPGFRENVAGKTRVLEKDEALSLIAGGEKDLEIDSLRSYPYKDVFSHVLGYIGQISEDELKNPKYESYKAGDLIGKMGIEEAYQSILRGIDGKELIEVNNLGETVRRLGQTDPIPGEDIVVTLDLRLQKVAFEAMKEVKKGAAIVSTPKGEILVLLSKPSFDPNLFTLGKSYKPFSSSSYRSVEEVLSDTVNQSLLNRAISGVYPPGSTFKLVVAASGLENKIINQNFEIVDTGVINVGAFSFSNWYFTQYGKTDGEVNIVKGIKRSNDVFFYKLGEKIGVDKISEMAEHFGLGKKLGIDLSGEEEGLIPSPSWKKSYIGEPWYLGDTYNYSIGQGYILTTPLQVNYWTQVFSNGGDFYRPHLIKGSFAPSKKNLIGTEALNLIREGMRQSCSPGGVAWPLFEFRVQNSKLRIDGKNFLEVPEATTSANFEDYRKVSVACKTGTAQHGGEGTLPHAWITLFAPAYDPEIVVTVLVEESGEGSNIAAPIAKKILEAYFQGK